MPKTFLDLVQDLHRESGASGAAPGSVTGQKGEAQRLVEWVKMADIEIQNLHLDWKFLYAEESLTITDASDVYPPPADHRHYDRETFKLELADGSKKPLYVQDAIEVRSEIFYDDKSEPWRVIIRNDDQLKFDEPPDQTYTCTYDYYTQPVELVNNTDTSTIPDYYRYGVIVGKALEYYADYEDAPEARRKAQLLLGFWLSKLEADQLPGQRYMHAQAEGNDLVVEVE